MKARKVGLLLTFFRLQIFFCCTLTVPVSTQEYQPTIRESWLNVAQGVCLHWTFVPKGMALPRIVLWHKNCYKFTIYAQRFLETAFCLVTNIACSIWLNHSPMFSYNCYKRVLISSAATSALRLHQRLPVCKIVLFHSCTK